MSNGINVEEVMLMAIKVSPLANGEEELCVFVRFPGTS